MIHTLLLHCYNTTILDIINILCNPNTEAVKPAEGYNNNGYLFVYFYCVFNTAVCSDFDMTIT